MGRSRYNDSFIVIILYKIIKKTRKNTIKKQNSLNKEFLNNDEIAKNNNIKSLEKFKNLTLVKNNSNNHTLEEFDDELL